MTVAEPLVDGESPRTSLDIRVARNLATTTKSVPQMRGITSRRLPRRLPWVPADGGSVLENVDLDQVEPEPRGSNR